MNSNTNGPLDPSELYGKLLGQDYKQLECQGEGERVKEERSILIELVAEYEARIEAEVQKQQQQINSMVKLKQELVVELERLRKERQLIDTQVTARLSSLREQRPVAVAEQDSYLAQVGVLRERNAKMRVRIEELAAYMLQLEQQNMRLEGERSRMSALVVREQTSILPQWRREVHAAKQAIRAEEADLHRLKAEREQATLRSIQAQQLQIKQRNRQRMMRVKLGQPVTPVAALNRSNVVDSQYYRPAS